MSTKSKSGKKVGFADDEQPVKSRESRSRFRSRSGRERRAKSEVALSNKETIPRKREHSLVSMVRNGGRNSVRNLVRLFESKTVSSMVFYLDMILKHAIIHCYVKQSDENVRSGEITISEYFQNLHRMISE